MCVCVGAGECVLVEMAERGRKYLVERTFFRIIFHLLSRSHERTQDNFLRELKVTSSAKFCEIGFVVLVFLCSEFNFAWIFEVVWVARRLAFETLRIADLK